MTTTYNPQKGSVAWKVIEFLTTNPDEQLSAEDVSVKFDTPVRGVHTMLGLAVTAGVLTRKEDLGLAELVYRLGKGHDSVKPSAATSPSLRTAATPMPAAPAAPAPAAQPSAPKARTRFWIDTSKLEVRRGVPMPQQRHAAIDWAAALDRLEVGDSYELPAEGKSAASKAMQAYQSTTGKKLAIRAESETTLGIWRMA